MELIDITTAEENNQIKMFVKNFDYASSDETRQWWIGATDLGSEGVFYWITTGDEIDFENFAPNQPDNHEANENCIELWDDVDFLWNDRRCDMRSFFICRRKISCKSYSFLFQPQLQSMDNLRGETK